MTQYEEKESVKNSDVIIIAECKLIYKSMPHYSQYDIHRCFRSITVADIILYYIFKYCAVAKCSRGFNFKL